MKALFVFIAALALAGPDAEEPRIGGTAVVGISDPGCLVACGRWDEQLTSQVIEGAFEVDSGLGYRPNLVSHVTIAKTRSRSRTTSDRRRCGATGGR